MKIEFLKFSVVRNAFVLDHEHGRGDVMCKPDGKKFHIRKVKCLVRGGCQFGGWNQVTNHHISLLLNSMGKQSAVRHDVQLCVVCT